MNDQTQNTEQIEKARAQFHNLALFDMMQLGNNMIMRVPNGWIFTLMTGINAPGQQGPILTPGAGGTPTIHVTSVFVPWHDEFNLLTANQMATKLGKESDKFYDEMGPGTGTLEPLQEED